MNLVGADLRRINILGTASTVAIEEATDKIANAITCDCAKESQ